ncbi:MAG: N-acetyl-gamma-glutamyl-phosphate reductase [Casimicrobiaceae bacterium]|nr:N-acetyl-gamma-glutamyl-phosphate reductase [Casimicrobiaceae bacterium]MCX8097878.1 N-acetyl-gamma-glutamyl-phosphate reductase [Casimicrobiaceae bacterium]MDW8311331.1 N-acetyl-gamma-glutamyl-phosphate reductase [Burkholderiales bacterium]
MTGKAIKVGIVGGSGYTGVELIRLLSSHPRAELIRITSRTEAGTRLDQLFPSLRGRCDLVFSDTTSADLSDCDVVFFATPHGVAMADAPRLVERGVRVIDLAADFRYRDHTTFERVYRMPHRCPDLNREAAYGLVELNRPEIARARVVGNPGCYPTTMQIGFAPLLRAQVVDPLHLIANCASGVSGAGKKAETEYLLCEASENFRAYNLSAHRHHSETVARLAEFAGTAVGLLFAPHLAPMIRGMHSTLYARLNERGLAMSDQELQAIFETSYRDEPFIDVLPWGSYPDTRSTRGSNCLRLALHRPRSAAEPGDTLVVLVVQDNLVKGAAGSAVQCMNLMFGLPESMGLEHMALAP